MQTSITKCFVIEKSFLIKIVSLLAMLIASQYFEMSMGVFLSPFFILDSSGDGADGGGDGGCDSGCADHDGGFSTPFISTWNGKTFIFENDFLFGKPNTLFTNKKEGMQMYESGKITPDLYRIQNNVQLRDGHFIAQIKEIEPEESFIDHLSLLRVVYPKNTELIVDSKFKDIHVFEENAIEKTEGVNHQNIKTKNTSKAHAIGNTQNIWKKMKDSDGLLLEPSESIEITGQVEDKSREAYLLLRAHYRDWTAGEIFNKKKEFDIHKILGVMPHVSINKKGAREAMLSFANKLISFGNTA
ncbi:MAG: hypothetical protein HYT93_02145 [Parcubacteria group bacterium]|nr:hypothetical protein [Parcubacteria group bacterium]